MDTITVDVLICGGGMSGMACATFCAEAGAKVLVAEKLDRVGGSSNYSAGMFWGPQNVERLRAWVPDGDAKLQTAWMKDYLPAVQWMRQSGVPTATRFSPIMTIGIGYPVKISHLHEFHQQRIAASGTGSELLLNTEVVELTQEAAGIPGSRVIGAVIRRFSPGNVMSKLIQVRANHVVLSTGGFQGSSELTSRHLGPGCDEVFVRSNEGSVGDGLSLALASGAGTTRGMSTYYGHLLAAPLRRESVDPKDFLPLAQYQSRHCLLINEQGRRFVDETMGDEIVNQYLAKQEKRRGFLLFNEQTRSQHCVSALFPNAGDIDRLEKARSHGCNVASAPSLDELIKVLNSWGVDANQTKRTIIGYRQVVSSRDSEHVLDAPVGRAGAPPAPLIDGHGPFFAMEVQPSITFTYGGIAIDETGRALTVDKRPVPGLLIAGVDAGGFSNLGYAGGLALAFVTGLWAAQTVARDLKLPMPTLPEIGLEDRDLASSARL